MRSQLAEKLFQVALKIQPPHPTRLRCRRNVSYHVSSCRNHHRSAKLATSSSALLGPVYPPQQRLYQLSPRRQFFNLSSILRPTADSPLGESGEALELATKQMMELVNAMQTRSRPPPPFILAKALRSFLQNYRPESSTITPTQVIILWRTFEHLATNYKKINKTLGAVSKVLDEEGCEEILVFLGRLRFEGETRKALNSFARVVWTHLSTMHSSGNRMSEIEHADSSGPSPLALASYIVILARTGTEKEAWNLLRTDWKYVLGFDEVIAVSALVAVTRGLIWKPEQRSTTDQLQSMEEFSMELGQRGYEAMTLMLAQESQCQWMQKMCDNARLRDIQLSTPVLEAVVSVAVRQDNGTRAWARGLLTSLSNKTGQDDDIQDLFLIVDAAEGQSPTTIGTGVRTILNKESAADPELAVQHAVRIINRLMDYSCSVGKYDDVELYASLLTEYGLVPDTQTHLLWMNTRVQKGDIAGALQLYEDVDVEALASSSPQTSADALLLNQLITVLCHANVFGGKEFDAEVIFTLVDRLFANNTATQSESPSFECSTLAALCQWLFSRDDIAGVSDLLRPLIGFFPEQQQNIIRAPFLDLIADPTTTTEKAWETYQLLNVAFPNTSSVIRTQIMNAFFQRRRSDLACLVFGHMRQRESQPHRPTHDSYAECFLGIAKMADRKNLNTVHNMLKLDMLISPSTRVLNALLLAYTTCGMANEALEFFHQILHSKEGPSEHTLSGFFRVCEFYHNGAEEAMRMLQKLHSLDVPIDAEIYTDYLAALAGHCQLELVAEALREMEAITGRKPSGQTYVSMIPLTYR